MRFAPSAVKSLGSLPKRAKPRSQDVDSICEVFLPGKGEEAIKQFSFLAQLAITGLHALGLNARFAVSAWRFCICALSALRVGIASELRT